jgi:hypothetical protein
MKPMVGVTQETNKDLYCSSEKAIEPGQSCILSLLVNGHEGKNIKNQGPVLCDNTWTVGKGTQVCAQPNADERINVHEILSGQASFTTSFK